MRRSKTQQLRPTPNDPLRLRAAARAGRRGRGRGAASCTRAGCPDAPSTRPPQPAGGGGRRAHPQAGQRPGGRREAERGFATGGWVISPPPPSTPAPSGPRPLPLSLSLSRAPRQRRPAEAWNAGVRDRGRGNGRRPMVPPPSAPPRRGVAVPRSGAGDDGRDRGVLLRHLLLLGPQHAPDLRRDAAELQGDQRAGLLAAPGGSQATESLPDHVE